MTEGILVALLLGPLVFKVRLCGCALLIYNSPCDFGKIMGLLLVRRLWFCLRCLWVRPPCLFAIVFRRKCDARTSGVSTRHHINIYMYI